MFLCYTDRIMPRRKEPIYRHVLRDAFSAAWYAKRIWPVALVAGILLSGSIYDVLWRLLNALSPQLSLGSFVGYFGRQAVSTWSQFSLTDLILDGIQVFQLSALLLIIAMAVAGLSAICQGALVFYLANKNGKAFPKVKEAITVGARAFWPIFVLNLLAILVVWATRTILGVALAITTEAGTIAAASLFFLAFIVFSLVAIIAVIIQIFALHAMILQGADLMQALERAGRLLREHWVIAAETAALLFVISVGAGMLFTAIALIFSIPLFMVLIVGTILGVTPLLSAALYVAIIGFFVVLLFAVAYLVTLQYATWTHLYQRLGEGGALPKVHRWFRQLVHGFHVPGS